MVNLPMTSVVELRGHRKAIAACFAFQREISSSVLWDFFNSIGQTRRFADAPITPGPSPVNRHHQTGPTGPFRARLGSDENCWAAHQRELSKA
jgi:hypothetical protein